MKKVIRNFFMDRLPYILSMLISSVLIIIFYTLTVSRHVEIIYPLIITVFLTISMLAIDWFRYYSFYRDMKAVQEDKNHQIKTFTIEQKEAAEAIKYINLKHAEKEQDILTDYENKVYFLSAAIHKFKNYIAVIGLIIEKNKYKNKDLEVILNDIEYENDNLCESLEQVLNYIRLDNFGNDFESVTINLYDELKEIINLNRNMFINNCIFPVLTCNETESAIVTDKKWNRAIIEQIITNAVKYSSLKSESKKIYFNITRKNKNLLLTIKDEGIGIPKYDLKKIFEPFFTGENGRKIRNSTGIGLYITKEIALKLGHQIFINSEVDMGTEVTIEYLSKL